MIALLPTMVAAKGDTTRIEISHGRRPFVTLTGPATAGQFTVWSGPGVSSDPGSGDFADWAAGAVEPPRKLAIFKVRFFCAAEQDPPPEVTPSHLCYGVRYAIDPETQQGYIQIPPEHDQDFPRNTQSIYRGVEGHWFRASARWEELVRPRIDAGLRVTPVNYTNYQQPYIYTPPASHTAVSAKSLVIPKK